MSFPERLPLARLPTPVTALPRLSERLGVRLWLWRDDLTGMLETGNKIRKLEFYAADAKQKGATRLITCGGPQSNHARATAVVARRIGLQCTLVIRAPEEGLDLTKTPTGNLLIDKLAGAAVKVVPMADYKKAGGSYERFLAEVAEDAQKRGERPYIIPEGGSGPLGCFGYIRAAEELLTTWRAEGPGSSFPDAVFLAVGSGGTLAGLHLGCEWLGLDPGLVHGVNICDDASYFQKRVGTLMADTARAYGLTHRPEKLNIHDGYIGRGYGKSTPDELREYADWFRQDGVLLDPTYTGKAFRGMVRELEKQPNAFGRDVVFVHTGGMFATFAAAADYHAALGDA